MPECRDSVASSADTQTLLTYTVSFTAVLNICFALTLMPISEPLSLFELSQILNPGQVQVLYGEQIL